MALVSEMEISKSHLVIILSTLDLEKLELTMMMDLAAKVGIIFCLLSNAFSPIALTALA